MGMFNIKEDGIIILYIYIYICVCVCVPDFLFGG